MLIVRTSVLHRAFVNVLDWLFYINCDVSPNDAAILIVNIEPFRRTTMLMSMQYSYST